MNYEKQAEMPLEALGKEMALSTANYVDSFSTKRKNVSLFRNPYFVKLQKSLVAVLIIGVLLTGFSTEVRAAVYQAFHYVIDSFTEYIRISPETPSPVDTGWKPEYELGWLPEEYVFIFEDSRSFRVNNAYRNQDNNDAYVNFWQIDASRYTISIDNEHMIHEITRVQDCEAHLYYELWEGEEDTPEGLCGNVILIWQKGDTTFELNSTLLSRADIMKIAENVVPKKPQFPR